MKLDYISAGVLYLLWHRRQNEDATLVSAKVLLNELHSGLAGKVHPALKLPAVKHSLRELRNAGMVEYGESMKSEPVPGPAPNGYRLSVDPPVITWPSMAAVLMLLHNHSERWLSRDVVIGEAMHRGLMSYNRSEVLQRDDVSGLIDWCIRKEYIKEEEITIDNSSTPRREKRLITTSKVDEFALFLQKIAGYPKKYEGISLFTETQSNLAKQAG